MAVVYNGTFEVDTQFHAAWFGATVTRSTSEFQAGAAALSILSTASFGTAVELNNFPYFAITELASYDFSLWHKYTVGATGQVTWTLRWRDDAVTLLQTDNILFTPTTSWAQVAATTIVAPADATRLSWTFTYSVAAGGPILWLDNILVEDTPASSNVPVKVWEGSAWVDGTWKVWDTSEWVTV